MAQFSRMDVLNRFYEVGLLPIFYNPDIDVCIQVADAAARGGSTILE